MNGHLRADILSAYLDRELVRQEEARVEVHLEDCDQCQRRLDGLRRVVAKLRSVENSTMPPFLAETLPHRISLMDRPRGVFEHFESRLKRMYLPKASVPLIFVLVVTLAVIVYFFSWGAYRSQQPSASVVVVPSGGQPGSSAGGQPGSSAVDQPGSSAVVRRTVVGGRSFVLAGDVWRQEGVVEEGRLVVTSSNEGRLLLEAEPELVGLLLEAPRVLLVREEEALLLGPEPDGDAGD